jgi:multiple antibiotic resistance protein
MMVSLLAGPFILKIYGISIPLLRVAGGLIVATAGWKLLNEGSEKDVDELTAQSDKANYMSQTFFPMTMPLTTGPGTIAVLISLGFSRESYSNTLEEFAFLGIVLLAATIIAITIYLCFAYSHWVREVLGHAGADIALRLSAFILFCLGVQIIWSGASELLPTLLTATPH